jgi:hypothetical protein
MATHSGSADGRKRPPSRLALQLADAFAPCAEWSEVRIVRGASGRRDRVIAQLGPHGVQADDGEMPYDWAQAA